MLGMMLMLIGGFVFMVRSSYRSARKRAAAGQPYQPDGKLRWEDS